MTRDLVADDDTPTHRVSVEEMSDEQLQDMLVNKRERRMAAYNVYEETLRMEKCTHNQRLFADLKKQGEMLEKKLATVDKALDAMDKYIVKIITIRNELGLEQYLKGDKNGSETTRNTDASTEQSRSSDSDLHVCTSGGTASDATDAEGNG